MFFNSVGLEMLELFSRPKSGVKKNPCAGRQQAGRAGESATAGHFNEVWNDLSRLVREGRRLKK
jgi:hypothetical protein